MKIAVYDKKAISNVIFTYLNKEDIILYKSDNISIKKDKKDKICYEILDRNEIIPQYFKEITKLHISLNLVNYIDILLEIPFKYILEKKEITYSSYYFNKFCKQTEFPYSDIYDYLLEKLKKLETVKYDIGYIEEKSEECIPVCIKGNLPLSMTFFIRKLEVSGKYYEYYLFF